MWIQTLMPLLTTLDVTCILCPGLWGSRRSMLHFRPIGVWDAQRAASLTAYIGEALFPFWIGLCI